MLEKAKEEYDEAVQTQQELLKVLMEAEAAASKANCSYCKATATRSY